LEASELKRIKELEAQLSEFKQIIAKHGRWGFELCYYWMRNHGYT
jgi:hypothetical protein